MSVSCRGCNCNGWPVEDVADSVITIVEVPEGVTTGGGVTGCGATLALPDPPHPPKTKTTNSSLAASKPDSKKCFVVKTALELRKFLKSSKTAIAIASKDSARKTPSGWNRISESGRTCAGPRVWMLTVNMAAAPVEIEAVIGAWQTAPVGAPLQDKATVPL